MAIPIIGQSKDSEATEVKLPEPDVQSLPSVDSVPAGAPIHDLANYVDLSKHEQAMVRTFAIGHLGRFEARAQDALCALIADPDPEVAQSAIKALDDQSSEAINTAIVERFEQADGMLAGECARYLAKHAPDRLVASMKKRSRLDDDAFAISTAELARAQNDEAIVYLDKSMNRAGTMSAERRSALYAAALLSGDAKLCQRVIGLALSDSKKDEPESGTSPARVAIASVAGLQLEIALRSQGEALLKGLRDDDSVTEHLEPDTRASFDAALRSQKLGEALAALSGLLDLEPRQSAPEEHKSIITRRKGLLRLLIEKKDAIEELGAGPGAIFIVAALDAAQMITLSAKSVDDSPALETLAKVLESDASSLAALSEEKWREKFDGASDRTMRGIVAPISNESMFDPDVLERIIKAMLATSHGGQLLGATGTARNETFVRLVLKAFSDSPEAAEPAIIEALNERPLEPALTQVALIAASRVPTQRIALTVGRRFIELREVARMALAETLFRLGDPRLAPIVKSRAFSGEPEELAWALLCLIGGQAVEGELAEAMERVEHRGTGDRFRIRLPLHCKRCDQTLVYGFESIYVDPKSDKPDGDPAFVGEPICKACGAYDELETTPTAVRLMTESMMRALNFADGGLPTAVLPRTTKILGRDVGIAATLRTLNDDVKASPDSIRNRLRRARVSLLLHRARAEEDIQAALAIDPSSIEAKVLLAGLHAQRDELDEAIATLLEVHARVDEEAEPKLYELDLVAIRDEVEESLLELESYGNDLPESLDLTAARHRRADREEARAEAMRRFQEQTQRH